ncbi:structural maintenance of chromosome protein, putative [Entamoeba invadens IP1]|uniref:Structural maintenance of chromosomes protein n=1 Tax=Entamoeba invadens IP1 TaxID=370355 RepID=A0A0A1UFJ1_ENTIV|nr:structural maintenance of chromosome protein, putative [Entamoeba invadens IP1]ELP91678.1 structural maintenance of chromosome protein, putative [Entamoeba invadens IP1]|eukprot:XP_004258449.1 structural maintenance of chromosome protein, putative [Entamoeba invadens IP1]
MEEIDTTTTRLVISQMVFTNFKSYYGRTELGPFHHSFTTIVGANGSGKSNVIDGLLFVFGRRGKQIRQSKLVDLIHKSSLHNDCREARVDVYLTNVNGSGDVVPSTNFVVSRSVSKDNGSKFYIDNTIVKIEDIQAKMKTKGFDLQNNRFLILQGEVERIALMPAKAKTGEEGMLEFLEDIIGTAKYIEPIDLKTGDLESLNDTVHDKTNRCRMSEKEKNAISPDNERAVSYVISNYEKIALEERIYREEKQKIEEEEKGSLVEIRKIEGNLKKITKLVEEKRENQKKIEIERNEIDEEIKKIEKVAEREKSKIASLKKRKARIDEEKKINDKAVQRNTKEIDEYTKKIRQEQDRVSDTRRRLEKLEASNSSDKEKIDDLENKIEIETKEILGKTQPVKSAIEKLKEQLSDPERRIDELKNGVSRLKAEQGGLQDRSRQASNQVELLSQEIKKLEEQQLLQVEEKKKEEDRIQELGTALQELDAQLAKSDFQVKTKKESLLEDRESLSALEQANEGVQSKKEITDILRRIEESGIQGVKGRLGDLGKIDDRYDVAITTACGMLDHIVVEKTEDAQKIAKMCREERLGRVSMIILEQMKIKKDWRRFDPIEGGQRLVDLIECDEWARDAFYFGMRDTIVSEDIETAKRISYGKVRQRVVTTKGELLDVVGTITGGGNAVMKGGMKKVGISKEDREAMERLKDKIKMGEDEMEKLKEENEELKKSREEKRKELKNVKRVENVNLERKIQEKKNEEKKAKENLKALTKDEKVKETLLNATEEKNNEEITKIENECSSLKDQLATQKKELEKLEGVGMKVLRVDLEDIKSRYTRNVKEAKRLVSEVNGSDGKIEEWEKMRAEIEDQLKKLSDKMEEAVEEVNEDELKNMKKEIKEKKNMRGEKETQIGAIEKTIEELDESSDKMKEQIDKIEKGKSGLNEARRKIVARRERNFEEIEKILQVANVHDEDQYLSDLKAMKTVLPNENKKNAMAMEEEVNEESSEDDEQAEKIKNKMEEEIVGANNERIIGISLKDVVDTVLERESEREKIEEEIGEVKKKIEGMEDGINLKVIAKYQEVLKDFKAKEAEMRAAMGERDECKKSLEELKKKRFDEFMNGLTEISFKLKEMYYLLTQGGVAELELVDTLNPFTEGVVFSVRPPKKAWKNITNLSGGEKTLSSLALIFALHHYRPTPIYVMDEIDAALDFRNVSIIAHYIKERTKNAQFSIISLRPEMFELADRLIGIHKVNDVSCCVAIDPSAFVLGNN